MKELSWVLQFLPLKDIMLASLIVHLLGSHLDEKIELHWDLQIELQMELNYSLMNELSWVLQFAPLKDIMMESVIVHLLGSH